MGLESVEMVIAVEEKFDIVIEDSEGEKIATPGELIDLILSKVDPAHWRRDQVSEIVRQIVIATLACERKYREDAHFVRDLGMS